MHPLHISQNERFEHGPAMDRSITPSAKAVRVASSEAPLQHGKAQGGRVRRWRVVQRASEFLRDHIAEGVRIADLSRVAGVSERALRNAFHREHGISPKQFDLRERLQGARRALCDGGPSRTVTTIASEFGFFELGRFSRIYKRAFGESPSHTIKMHNATTRARI
jgi:transcriptional regulator GlxA family with amidase domain